MGHGILLLDFDGTLSPIVKDPAKARLLPGIKAPLKKLAAHAAWIVGIVSGREIKFLKKQVKIPRIIFVGNHGFEIKMPGKKIIVHPAAKKAQKHMTMIHNELKKKLRHLKGVIVENKKWSISIHTRQASKRDEALAIKISKSILKAKPIAVTLGKKVLEVRPRAKWNKGEAVKFLLKRIKKKGFPIYIGDDKTDEDAFRVLKTKGLTIRVGEKRKSAAQHTIRSVHHMPQLLKVLADEAFTPLIHI